MSTNNARFMLAVPEDILKQSEALKRELFYNKPYAEMYRQLIQLGLDTLQNDME